MKILLIEDNPGDADLVRRALSKSENPFDVQWCMCLSEAVERDDLHTFNCMLVDLSLPDSHGLETVSALRQRVPDRPLVVLTSLANDTTALEALELGAQDYVVKDDVDTVLLVRSIRYAIGRQQALNENQRLFHELAVSKALLEKKNCRLQKLYKAAQEFVDTVSHEFRTPLTVIKEYGSLMREEVTGAVNADQRRLLTVIEDRADDLNTMVDDMLDSSKLESGLLGVHRKECRVADVVEHVMPSLERKAAVRNVALETAIDDRLPSVFCDDEKAGRVIINLVINAIKFCGDPGRVRLAAYYQQQRHEIVIRVSDNGPGIDAGRQQQIFERFRQLHTTEIRGSTKGFGLGLSIAKELVELNLGQIDLRSAPGEGSTFSFTLPVAEPREIASRYLAWQAQSQPEAGLMSLVAVTADTQGDTALANAVDGFFNVSLRRDDLLLRRDEGRWLMFLPTPPLELDHLFARMEESRSCANHNRPGLPLPEFTFDLIGSWRVGDERPAVLAAVWESCSNNASKELVYA